MDTRIYRNYDKLYLDPECTKECRRTVSHGVPTFWWIDSNGNNRSIALPKFKRMEHDGMCVFPPNPRQDGTQKTQSSPKKTQSDDAKKFLDEEEFALYNDLMKKIQDRRASYDIRKKSYDDMMNSLKILGISGAAAKPFIDNYIKTVGPIDSGWEIEHWEPDWDSEKAEDYVDSDD